MVSDDIVTSINIVLGKDATVKDVVDELRIHLLPDMDPTNSDLFEKAAAVIEELQVERDNWREIASLLISGNRKKDQQTGKLMSGEQLYDQAMGDE